MNADDWMNEIFKGMNSVKTEPPKDGATTIELIRYMEMLIKCQDDVGGK
jgi:hypothetical protein